MILFRSQIHLDRRHRAQVLRSLVHILEPTRALPGCLSSQLYTDIEDDDVLLLVEQWADEQALTDRLRSDGTRVLLSALDFSSDPPDVRFNGLGRTRGIEFIAACRKAIGGSD